MIILGCFLFWSLPSMIANTFMPIRSFFAWWIPAWFGGLIVAGALLYYIPRFVRARRGINVSFVYKELPPE